ncbi:hypothetical protein F5Y15DRAFT_409765 [Xylariaceae sp. FL0016]|nr:hypothetical protein F5Y15DRAFT_409765 [Xylariaceae sp. FL0016]
MDHLPKPIGGIRPQVPFKAYPKVYTPHEFVKVPRDYGYTSFDQLVEYGIRPDMEPKKANAFIQGWLYFGLLARVLDQETEFSREIQAWKHRESVVEGQTYASNEQRYIRTSEAFSVDTRITLSIAVLGEILQRERPNLVGPQPSNRVDFFFFFFFGQNPDLETRRWGHSKYCRKQMQENNWCLSEIRRLESTMPGVCEVYYASSSKPRNDADHSQCTWDGCQATVPSLLGHILRRAWLSIGEDAAGSNNRRILQCRALQMQKSFNKLILGTNYSEEEDDVPFYVDVLCYPRQVNAQAQGLYQMKQVYSSADAVLLWGRDLLRAPKLSNDERIEMNVNIRLGNWTKSLWTLFEAVLAKNITVALSDEMITFEELEKAKQEAKNDLNHEYHHVYRAGHPFSEAVYQLRKIHQDNDPKHLPKKVWCAVQFQTIDDPPNEALILAALMKLDIKKLDIASEQHDGVHCRTVAEQRIRLVSKRMVKLLQLMDSTPGLGIPSGLIFLPAPKLRREDLPETKLYGWASRTWLTRQAHPRSLVHPLKVVAISHMNGLLVNFPGLIVHGPELLLAACKFCVPVHQSRLTWFKIVAYPDQLDFQDWSAKFREYHELMVILSEADPVERGAIGLLVNPKGTLSDGLIRWVDILCRVWVRLETDRKVVQDLSDSFREFPDRALFGTRLIEEKWCVDGLA